MRKLLIHDMTVLQSIRTHNGKTRDDIVADCGLDYQVVQRSIDRLRINGLAESERMLTGRYYSVTITQMGRKALVSHARGQRLASAATPTPPRCMSVYLLTDYKPAKNAAFVRNDGHRGILSRGLAC